MIKRYGLGRKALSSLADTSVYGPEIVEIPNGEFYRCADIDPLLESIGAGGVSGRVDVVNSMVDMLKEASAKADKEAIDAHNDYGQDVANVYKCVAWRVKVLLVRAEQIRDSVANKTIEQHRAEFELWLSSVETRGATDFERYMEDGFYMDWDVQRAWISWKAARGITE